MSMAKNGEYVAKVGITFESLKGKPHINAGETLPSLPQAVIDDLLECGNIELKSKETEDKEAE